MFPKLSIIIVSYNTKDLTLKCLKSVFAQKHLDFEVIVVDNHSTDGSPQAIKKQFPQVKLIQNQQNVGFAKANNQGIQKSRGDYFLLLNSDTVLAPKCLVSTVEYMDANHIIGIVSPQLLNPNGSIQPNGGSLPNLLNIFTWQFALNKLPLLPKIIKPYQQQNLSFFKSTQETGWVSGTAMFIRKTVLEDIGLLDEKIFMYSEDTDLCLRAKKEYYDIFTCSQAQVTHFSHSSGSQTKAVVGEFKGLVYLWKKHKPAWQLPLLKLILLTGAHLRALIFAKIKPNEVRYDSYKQAITVVK